MVYEHTHDAIGYLAGVSRPYDDPGIARAIFVAGKAAQAKPKPDARLETKTLFYKHRLEPDVVGILQNRDRPRAIECNIEFARQTIQRAVIKNVKVPFARKRLRVDQLLWIDPRRRRASDVSDVVGTGPARTETDVLDTLNHGHCIACSDFANLKVRPRRDMRVAPAKTFGKVRNASELRGFQNTVRNTKPAHISILIGRHIKQAEKAPAEIIRRFRIFAFCGMCFQPLIAIEWMLFALEFLRI